MKQSYLDRARASMKINGKYKAEMPNKEGYFEHEWNMRVYMSSMRLLSAISYKITSKKTYEKTKSVMLPIIGLYYSLFHLSVAILYLDYSTEFDDLKKVKHKKLINLVEKKIVERKLVGKELHEQLGFLKNIREKVNYEFTPLIDSRITGFLKDHYLQFSDDVDLIFDQSIAFIHDLSENTRVKVDNELVPDFIISNLSLNMADGLVDDIFMEYVSHADEEDITIFLLDNSLTY